MNDRELKLKVHFEAMDKLTGPLKGMFDGAGKARGEMGKLTKSLAAQKRELSNMTGEYEKLRAEYGKESSILDELNAKMSRQKNLIDQTAKSLEKKASIVRNSAQMKAVGQQAMGLGAGATAAGAVIAAPLVASTRAAMDLEGAMADVRKVSDFDDAGFKALTNDIKTLSTQVPLTAMELSKITAQGAQDNIGGDLLAKGDVAGARKALIDFTRDTAQMSVAFGVSADVAADNMSAWRAGLHLTQGGVRDLANQINALENTTTGGTASGISDIVTRVGALGGVAGMAGNDVAAISSMMDGLKIPTEVAATGIQNMALALTQGTAATKSQRAAFAQIGLSAEDVAKKMQVDAQGTILDVFTRISQLDKAARPAALTELFGRESIKSIAPMLGALPLLKEKFDFVNNSANSTNSMLDEFERRNKTTSNSVKLLQNNLFNAKVTLGDQLAPAITSVANWLSKVITKFNEWSQKHPKLAQGLVLFLAIIAALLLIGGPLIIGIGAIAFAMGALGITSIAAALPFILIAAGIAAVIALGVILMQNWAAVSAWWSKMTKGFMDDFNKNFWYGLITLPTKMLEFGGNILGSLVSGILAALPKVFAAIWKVGVGIKDIFMKSLEIHSPSRVFRGFGENINAGLGKGLFETMKHPIAIAGRITAGVAAAGMASGGAMAAPAQNIGVGASSGANFGNITIQINQLPGQNAHDLAQLVRQEIEKMQAQAQTRQRSSYRDI